jgi:hypothetical protein
MSRTKRARPGRRSTESGAAMMLVVTLLAALLAGGALAIYLEVSDTRATSYVPAARRSLYCAEAGLAAARPIVGANYATWVDVLDGNPENDPPWYPITGDIDDPPDGVPDYEVAIRDNDDELAPAANDPTHDNDLEIFVVSTCIKYPDSPREVLELVMYKGGGAVYRNQSGQGSGNTGNTN